SFGQQQLGEVAAVLPGDAGDEGGFRRHEACPPFGLGKPRQRSRPVYVEQAEGNRANACPNSLWPCLIARMFGESRRVYPKRKEGVKAGRRAVRGGRDLPRAPPT